MFGISRRYQPLIVGVLGFLLTACPGDNGPNGAPSIDSFSATPATVAAGSPVTLTWSVSGNPTGLSVDNGVGAVSGTTRVVTPTTTTIYTLTATNSSGESDTETTTVTVTGTPPPVTPPSGTAPDFAVSASEAGPFTNDAGSNILSAADDRVVNVAAGGTFYARVSYSDPEGVSNIVVYLANRSPSGFLSDLAQGQNVKGFTLGAPLAGCDLSSRPTSVTCVYPVTVAAGTPNITGLPGVAGEFAYVLRTRVTDGAGTEVNEPPRGYVTVGSGGGTTGGGTTGGTTGTTTGGTTGSTTGTTTGSTTGGTTGTTTGGTTTGGTTGGGSAFSVSIADVAPVTLSGSTVQVSLNGTVSNAPSTGTTSTQWTAVGNNSGNVSFASPSFVDTTATFSASGTYTLELEANNIVGEPDDDNVTTRSDTVQVVVNPAGGGDTTRPTATLNQAAGQADPARGFPIVFTVVFSENVTGFNRNDVELGGAGAAGTGRSNVSVFGSGAAYRVEVSGLSATGSVTAAVSSNAAVDAAGNRSDRSTGDDPTVRYQP